MKIGLHLVLSLTAIPDWNGWLPTPDEMASHQLQRNSGESHYRSIASFCNKRGISSSLGAALGLILTRLGVCLVIQGSVSA